MYDSYIQARAPKAPNQDIRARVESARTYLDAVLSGRVTPDEGLDSAIRMLEAAKRFVRSVA
jgi:hypothetical protein